jgi:2-oxoglutarate/2-oxoacid ferredoxin oxidoreductase subunit alpha
MRLNILIGGKAGQGINKISSIVSKVFTTRGYYTFNYRDYPSLIRGGHNFNILCISDQPTESHDWELDGIVAMDDNTVELHKKELKKGGFIIPCDEFLEFGRNLNIALSGALMKILGVDKESLIQVIKEEMKNDESVQAAEKGFESEKKKLDLKNIKKELKVMTGSEAVAIGAVNSKIDLYFGYPMTPATTLMSELANKEFKENFLVFQPEDEIAAANAALGASFAGAKTMIGTSGGGFDLMTEALSLQGMTELPLVACLVTRPGPSTGVPTYTSQSDLNLALRAGHGEFPRVIIAPANPIEAIEKTNEAFYLSEKHGALAIVLSDKHLAESEYAFEYKIKKPLAVEVKRKVPGEGIVKVNSYEHNELGYATDSPLLIKKANDARLKRYDLLKKECNKFEMYKIHGKANSKNLIIGWGSTSGAIKDAIKDLDYKFLQVIYMKPLSDKIKDEIKKAKKVILIEANLTGQLGRLIREKTGISIPNRMLKYDGRPFTPNEIRKELSKIK